MPKTRRLISDERALRRACDATPDDEATWLIYSDWLRDHGRDDDADWVQEVIRIRRRDREAALVRSCLRSPFAKAPVLVLSDWLAGHADAGHAAAVLAYLDGYRSRVLTAKGVRLNRRWLPRAMPIAEFAPDGA